MNLQCQQFLPLYRSKKEQSKEIFHLIHQTFNIKHESGLDHLIIMSGHMHVCSICSFFFQTFRHPRLSCHHTDAGGGMPPSSRLYLEQHSKEKWSTCLSRFRHWWRWKDVDGSIIVWSDETAHSMNKKF